VVQVVAHALVPLRDIARREDRAWFKAADRRPAARAKLTSSKCSRSRWNTGWWGNRALIACCDAAKGGLS